MTVVAAGQEAEDRVAVASNWKLVWWRFRRHHLAMASAALLILLYVVVLVPDFFSTQDPERTEARQRPLGRRLVGDRRPLGRRVARDLLHEEPGLGFRGLDARSREPLRDRGAGRAPRARGRVHSPPSWRPRSSAASASRCAGDRRAQEDIVPNSALS